MSYRQFNAVATECFSGKACHRSINGLNDSKGIIRSSAITTGTQNARSIECANVQIHRVRETDDEDAKNIVIALVRRCLPSRAYTKKTGE